MCDILETRRLSACPHCVRRWGWSLVTGWWCAGNCKADPGQSGARSGDNRLYSFSALSFPSGQHPATAESPEHWALISPVSCLILGKTVNDAARPRPDTEIRIRADASFIDPMINSFVKIEIQLFYSRVFEIFDFALCMLSCLLRHRHLLKCKKAISAQFWAFGFGSDWPSKEKSCPTVRCCAPHQVPQNIYCYCSWSLHRTWTWDGRMEWGMWEPGSLNCDFFNTVITVFRHKTYYPDDDVVTMT